MRPLVYLVKLSLYLNDFEPSKDLLGVLHLWWCLVGFSSLLIMSSSLLGMDFTWFLRDFAKLLSNFSAVP
jgi:hypothetical protein